MDTLNELTQFLTIDTRYDLKLISVEQILGLTAYKEMCNELSNTKHINLIQQIIKLIADPAEKIAEHCLKIVLNLTAERTAAENLLKACPEIIDLLFKNIINPESYIADECCKIFNNLTSVSSLTQQILDYIQNHSLNLDQLIASFVISNYNKKKCDLNYLAKVFGNLTQSVQFREYVLDKEKCIIQRLIPFTEYVESNIRREGIVALIKNCCFESENHEWLLGEEVDILPKLLLPLTGGEEFDDEDNDKLPIELQYLPTDKQRENNVEIKKMLLETLLQLCSIQSNREYIRNKNTYAILRELHKVEKNKEVLLACENVVDILIRTEDEINVEDFNKLEVPDDMKQKFVNMDEEFLKD